MYASSTTGIVAFTSSLFTTIGSACIIATPILALYGNVKDLFEARDRLVGDLCDTSAFQVTTVDRVWVYTYGSE